MNDTGLVGDPPNCVVISHRNHDYVSMAMYTLCTILGGPPNLAVFHNLVTRRSPLRSSLLLKLQLNISDLIVVLIYAPGQLIRTCTVHWYGGELMCKVMRFVDNLGFKLSGAMVAGIGVDRFLSILCPIVTETNRKRTKIIVGIAWVYSILTSGPNLLIWHTHEANELGNYCPNQTMCGLIFNRWYRTGIISFETGTDLLNANAFLGPITSFWLPALISVICYVGISHHVWRHYRSPIEKLTNNSSTLDAPYTGIPTDIGLGGQRENGNLRRNTSVAAAGRNWSRRLRWKQPEKAEPQRRVRSVYLRGDREDIDQVIFKFDGTSTSSDAPKDAINNNSNGFTTSSPVSFCAEAANHAFERRQAESFRNFRCEYRGGTTAQIRNLHHHNNNNTIHMCPPLAAHSSRALLLTGNSASARTLSNSVHRSLESTPSVAQRTIPRKTLKMAMKLMGVFVVMWLPYQVLVVLTHYVMIDRHWAVIVFAAFQNLMLFNSVLNPFIYATQNLKPVWLLRRCKLKTKIEFGCCGCQVISE